MVEPPRASPRHPAPHEGDTSPGIATTDYVKRKLSDAEATLDELLKHHDNKLTLRSVVVAVGAVAAGVMAAITFVDNRVSAQTDAGVRVLSAEQRALDARVTTMEKRLDRVDDKLDLLLDAARVPQWKRPPPVDGGQ